MRCTRLTPSDTPCGKPAIAVWQDRAGRLTWTCATCDRAALRACSLDGQWWTEWERLPLAPAEEAVPA